MSLIFFDGLQDAVLHRKVEWDSAVAFVNQTGRDGSTNGAASVPQINSSKYLVLPSSCATVIAGFGFQVATALPFGGQGTLIGFSSSIAGGTSTTAIGVNANGLLEARYQNTNSTYNSGTLIGTASHDPIQMGQWRHLQVKILPHTSAGSVELLLDGVTVLSVSGVKTNNSNSAFTHAPWAGLGTQGGGVNTVFWDDLWICDAVDATSTQGRPNNDYLGDLKVTTLIPTANGDLTAWAKSTGTNAAALLDEVPPNTTDYISSSTSAQRELMVIPDLPATTGLVFGTRVCFYGLKTDAGPSLVKPLVKESGGTITAQTGKGLSTTAAGYAGEFMWGKPTTPTTPWTAAEVNGLQAGVELA